MALGTIDMPATMSAIQTHATVVTTALGSVGGAWDVAIAPPLPRGKSVRIFYGGPRKAKHFTEENTLTSQVLGQAVIIRAFWPVADYAKLRRKNLMVEMASWTRQLRVRLLGDYTLGGLVESLEVELDDPDDILFGSIHFAMVDTECVVEYDEFVRAA